MSKLLELQEKRANIWEQAKAFLDEKQAAGDTLSTEDAATYDKMETDVMALGKEIDRLKTQAAIDLELSRPASTAIVNKPAKQDVTKHGRFSDAYAPAFWDSMRGKSRPEIRNTLKEGADPQGGYLVPDEFERTLIQMLAEENVLRSLSHVIQTASGDHKIPVVASEGTAAWTDEEAAYTESNTTFGQVSIGAHKLGTLVKVSEELLNDSAFDLEGYMAQEFARRLGNAEEEAFLTGTGTDRPSGILVDTAGASDGSTAASATAITFDDLIELYYSLREPYRKSATLLLHESTVKAIRKLKDTQGQYIWQPSVSADVPDKILNCPVVTSRYMPQMAADAKTVLFGDFSYYWIADRQGRTFKRLNELYAVTGQVGFLGSQRVDAKIVLPEAIKTLKQASK